MFADEAQCCKKNLDVKSNVYMDMVQNQVWNQEPAFCCDGCKNTRTLREHFGKVFSCKRWKYVLHEIFQKFFKFCTFYSRPSKSNSSNVLTVWFFLRQKPFRWFKMRYHERKYGLTTIRVFTYITQQIMCNVSSDVLLTVVKTKRLQPLRRVIEMNCIA